MLGLIPFHLAVYSIANKGKETKFKSWVKRTIGEEPVLLDTALVRKTIRQMQLYLYGKGYFNSTVRDSIVFKDRQASVNYIIDLSIPYTIRKKFYKINDPILAGMVNSYESNSKIREGAGYDSDLLQQERDRITTDLRNHGYFFFNKEYIYIEVDSTLGSNQLDIYTGIRNPEDAMGNTFVHKPYSIRNIYIRTDFDPRLINDTVRKDTIIYKDDFFIYSSGSSYRVKPAILHQSIFLKKGWLFMHDRLENTYKGLSDLGVFRFVDIRFEKCPDDTVSNLLDCYIQLTPSSKQNFGIETDMRNRGGSLGLAGSTVYRNKNFFRNAELMEVKMNGGFEAQKSFVGKNKGTNLPFFNTFEVSPEANLNFQKFLLPFRIQNVSQYSAPRTTFSLSYNYQERPEYTRSIVNFSYGYNWKESKFWKYIINPAEINLVDIYKIDPAYEERLNDFGAALRSSYKPHFIPSGRYSWVFNNQVIGKNKSFIYFRANFEASGNFFWLCNKIANAAQGDKDVSYLILGKKYSQYIRPDIDFRYYQFISQHNTIAYRALLGMGFPYLNSSVLPFEKSFSAGGSNDIRAWPARTLGRGTFDGGNVEQTGDIKIEGNVELRFDVIKLLQGALFVDAGNIWSKHSDANRPGSQFVVKNFKFIDDMAIGTGLGARLNFTFFIIRLDGAYKVKDPSSPYAHRWANPSYLKLNQVNWNFGIGYPF